MNTGLCQSGVYLFSASDDFVIWFVFHQAVRVELMVMCWQKLDFLIDCGRKGRSAIVIFVHWFCSSSSHG